MAPKVVRTDSLTLGRELAQSLASGWQPTPIPPPFHLPAGEVCFSSHDVQLYQRLEGDSSYVHKSWFGFNLLAVFLAIASAIGNSARKRRAARQAQARFRWVDRGALHLTNRRFAIQGQGQWIDLWFHEIRMSYCEGDVITLELASIPPVQLHAYPGYPIFALFRHFAYGEIVQL